MEKEPGRLNLSVDAELKALFSTACALRRVKMTSVVTGWMRSFVAEAFEEKGMPNPLAPKTPPAPPAKTKKKGSPAVRGR